MDRQTLALLIPVLALTIPVVAIVFGSLVKIARFRAEAQRTPVGGPELDARLASLEDEVAALRHELSEAHERLDFTERLLTQRSSGSPPDANA